MANHRVEAIANAFLDRAAQAGRSLSNMQLQKLPYFAHGWGLVVNNETLLDTLPKAWKYGPVYPDLYYKLSRYGSGVVDSHIHENDANPLASDRGPIIRENLSPEEDKLLDSVWAAYGDFDAFQLSALTHQPNSPWTITRKRWGEAPISNELMQQHFIDRARERKGQQIAAE